MKTPLKPHTLIQRSIIPLIASGFTVFQLSCNGNFEFHRDELLYLSLGQHPAAGYYSVPPFIGFIAFLSIKLFGYTMLAARFFPAIAGGLLLLLVSRIVTEAGGSMYARLLAVVSTALSLVSLRAFGLLQPVPFDILFWTLSLFLLVKYFKLYKNITLLLFGISLGLGILNKYNIVFLVFAMVPALLLTTHRKIFLSRYPYIATGLTLLIILPNILWQVKHGFPVVNHMTELVNSQLAKVNPMTFLFEQLLMIFPATIIVLPGLVMLASGRHLKNYRIFIVFSLFVIVIYLLLKGKSYYTAGIYPLLIALSSVAIETRVRKGGWLRPGLILTVLITGFLILPMGKPVCSAGKLVRYFDITAEITGTDAIRRDEDNHYNKLPQDYSDMLGWEELAFITQQGWQMVHIKDHAFIFCENYGQAGAINILGKQYHLPEAVSFSDNFQYLVPKTFKHEITEVVYINDEIGNDVSELFGEINLVGKISHPLAREYGTGVYLCRKPVRSFNVFWAEIQ